MNDFIDVTFETRRSKPCFFAQVTNIELDDVFVEYLEKSDTGYQYAAKSTVY